MAPKKGARNPKAITFSVRLDEIINTRLEELADAAGANKGTMAAMAIAAGVNLLEQAFIRQTAVIEQATAQRAAELHQQTAEDAQRAADIQEQAVKRPFKLDQSERAYSEWSGYMAGL